MISTRNLIVLGAGLLSKTFAAPFSLPDGFPNPNQQQLQDIQVQAHGTLPNTPPPSKISETGIANLRLIQFNENFEVAYFSSLLSNVTNNVEGYTLDSEDERTIVIDALTAVVAQEELHSISAGAALKSQGQEAIAPCEYKYPVDNFQDAITLATTFTDVVVGTLQSASEAFAENGDKGVPKLIASIIGQEGEQNGAYRLFQKKGLIPSALPFLTNSVGDFAYSALQAFVVKGSCPNQDLVSKALKIFAPLNVLNKDIQPVDQNLKFSFDIATLKESSIPHDYSSYDWNQASLVYINQQNLPIVVKIQDVVVSGSMVTFSAPFPYSANLLNSLTIAAVTTSSGPFADNQAVADATVFGPGLIEVN